MAQQTVTVPGYYAGRFLKVGQSYEDGAGGGALSKLTKDELLALAADRGIEVDASATKAAIIKAISA